MKQLIKNYSFNSTSKTVTLTDFTTVILERLQLIVDTTTNTILYNFADSSVATATPATNVFTLSTVGSASSSDKLMIIYDCATGDPTYDSPTAQFSDGTNKANVIANDSGYNGQVINNGAKVISFTTSATGAQTLLTNTDVRGYGNVVVVVTSIGTGVTWNGQFAATSGGTYVSSLTWAEINNANSLPVALQTASPAIYTSMVQGAYFQLAFSAMTGGTTSGYVILQSLPQAPYTVRANQYGNWSVGASSATGSVVPSNAFYVGASIGGNLTGLSATNTADAIGLGTMLTTATSLGTYNGTNYDRARSASTAAATTGTGLLGTGALGIYNSSAPTVSNGNYERLQLDSSANLKVTVQPSSSGGLTTYRNLDTQSTGVNVKNATGVVHGWFIANNASSVRYVKLYNKATAPTVGTDTPMLTIPIPANSASNVEYPTGITFSSGIGIGGVTGVADANTTAPTANDIICNLFYV